MSRSLLIGPVICTLIGVGVGVCIGMIYHQDLEQRARVYIGDSLPLASRGALVGILVGGCIFGLVRFLPRLLPAITIAMATALGAVMVAPLGWMLGDLTVQLARRGMIIGAIIGTIVGFLVGVRQCLEDKRRRAEPIASPDRGGSIV